jgi:hypothetical protein
MQMNPIRCKQCAQVVEEGASFCTYCGLPLQATCEDYGTANYGNARYCGGCGVALRISALSTAPARNTSAFSALNCPRCTRANEPGATFCYQCGLPLDKTTGITPGANWGGDELGGFWVRFGALLIDTLLLGLFVSLPSYLLLDPPMDDAISNLIELGYLIIAVAIWGRTIGKKVSGLKIVRVDGTKVGPGRALARPFAWY